MSVRASKGPNRRNRNAGVNSAASVSKVEVKVEANPLLKTRLKDLETAKAELARQNRELAASKATLEFEQGRYHELFNCAPDAYFVTDLAGTIREVNQAACRMLERSRGALQGLPLLEFFSADDRRKLRVLLPSPDRIGRVEPMEGTLRYGVASRKIACSLSVNAMMDAAGQMVGARWLVRDITQRQRVEEQQRWLFRLMQIVNRAEDLSEIYKAAVLTVCNCLEVRRAAILLYDPDNVMRFEYAHGLSTDYCRAVEGHTPWEAGALDPEALSIEDVAQAKLEDHLRQALEREEIRAVAFIPITFERRVIGKFMVYYDAPHRFAAEELALVNAVASPVSFAVQRQRAAGALAEAKHQLEQHTRNLEKVVAERTAKLRETIGELEAFSYSLSHDLRAPLRAMRSFSELLQARYSNVLDEEGTGFLDRIITASGRLDRLIQDVLAYTRVTMAPVQQETLDVEDLIRQILREHQALQEPNATVEVSTPLHAVIGHEAPLTQCIYNLLSNAVKFVEAGKKPRIRIWSERADSQVTVWFEDNGIGIPKSARARMFLMFQRFHRPDVYEGTGIGLAIVRRAVERMGGSAGVDSEEGTGSRFWLRLPAAPVAPNPP